jgi:large repetitive protein
VTITYTTGASSLSITTSSPLPNASIGHSYSTTLAATGGTAPYTWSRSAGGLPRGLSLSSGGTISGTVNAYGSYSYTARVTDSAGNTATKKFQLTVMPRGDLAVALFHNGTFHAGQRGRTFSVHVTNTGTAATSTAATNEVRFSVPDGLVVTQGGRGTGWQCSKQRHSSTCRRNAAIGSGATTTITVTVRVTASSGSSLTATAKVSPTDFTWGDNTDTDTVFIHS